MLALVTAAAAEAYDPDLAPLVAACTDLDVEARVVCWDDAAVDWGAFDAVLLRSTWDYVDRLDDFRSWLAAVAVVTAVVNSTDAIEWNLDKHYLAQLCAEGVPIVRTTFVEIGDPIPSLDRHQQVWVVKPAIGAGANGARRCRPDEVAAHVAELHAGGWSAMVQPYLDLIDEHAETSLVFLGDGTDLRYDHAFSKGAILTSTDVEREGDLVAVEQIGPRTASDAELALADQVLATDAVAALGPLAYARVDVAPTVDGPVLMELELVEPSLYFRTAAGSAERAVVRWARFLTDVIGVPSAGS